MSLVTGEPAVMAVTSEETATNLAESIGGAASDVSPVTCEAAVTAVNGEDMARDADGTIDETAPTVGDDVAS